MNRAVNLYVKSYRHREGSAVSNDADVLTTVLLRNSSMGVRPACGKCRSHQIQSGGYRGQVSPQGYTDG